MSKENIEDREYTHEEYDQLLKESDYKFEYHAGRLYAMAGGHPNHNRAQSNIFNLLSNKFRGEACFVFSSDQSIDIGKYDRYVFPDVSVVCGKEEYTRKHHLKNPSIIVEVASKSTADYDKEEKMSYYFSLSSLKEYVIISVAKPVITVHSKENDKWTTAVFMGLKSKIHLPNFNLDLEMKDIYRRVTDLEEPK